MNQREKGFFENYKEKLDEFNQTEKYKKELRFLCKLMQPKKNELILDYGCGTGYAMRCIKEKYGSKVYGYDKYKFYEGDPFYCRTEYHMNFSKTYFMHSVAHIWPIEEKINELTRNTEEICVITPNLDWLDHGYAGDTTVVNHFTEETLAELFKDYRIEDIGQFGEKKNGQRERIYLKAINRFEI